MIDPANDEGRPRQGGPDVDKVLSVTDPPIVAPSADELAAARSRRASRLAHEHLRAAGCDSELVRHVLGVGA